jgi:predicted nucleic acid-binding protein
VALVTPVFFDTTVLLGGCIDFGRSSVDAQRLLDDVADGSIRNALTGWHCCLEFYAVATRLPGGYRLAPQQAWRLLQEILAMFQVEQLPEEARLPFLEAAVRERVAGGRVYDAHIAEVARLAGASVVVTDNRRHFTILMKHGVRVLRASEFAEERRRS